MKGLPSGYNRDLQCAKSVVRRGVERLLAATGMTAAFLAELDFDPEKLAASLEQGHINATLRMEENVLAGVPLRAAHHAVAAEVTGSTDSATPRIESPLDRYRTSGGTGPGEVRRIARNLLETDSSQAER